MKNYTKKLLFLLLVFLCSNSSFASHIVGGEISVKYLSGNAYKVTLSYFRDCNSGVDFVPNEYIGIYSKSTNVLVNWTRTTSFTRSTVPLGDACYNPGTCMEKAVYEADFTLLNDPGGYYVSHLRCCRNAGIVNLAAPSNQQGFIFYCEIPNPALHNSSPTFNKVPDGYMCSTYPNLDDFSCSDVDGDSLSYEFTTPLSCIPTCNGTTGTQPAPPTPGPYNGISWAAGYNLSNQMGDIAMKVNSKTGIVSTTPPSLGLFVFCVKVSEYRNGVKIGEIRRDFQFKVLACDLLNVQYTNSPICVGADKTLSANGVPSPPYTYSWSPTGQTTPTIVVSPTVAGTYTYTLTAKNSSKPGCETKANAIVTVNSNPVPSVATTGNVCLAQNTTLSASGGGSYSWQGPGGYTGTSKNIAPPINGTYTVTVTNAAGCTATATGFVYNAPLLTSTLTVSNVACSGNPASATLKAGGGSPNYSYLWSNGATTTAVTGLSNGSYTVTTTDIQGCTSKKTFNILITSTPTVSATSTQAGCTVANGSATAVPSGGTGVLSYYWLPGGQTDISVNNLAVGTYTVIAASSGCSDTATVTVAPTANPSVTATATNTGCTVANGTATANSSGGVGTHTYLWSPTGQTAPTATGLFGGVYNVQVTDANGCTANNTATVTAAGGPTASTTVNSNVSCFGGNNGSAIVNATGGTPNYTYVWDNGVSAQAISGLAAGTYVATVTDANGCVYSAAAIIITQPTQSLVTTMSQQKIVSCFGGSDGVAIATPSGGTPAYTYSWDNGQTTQTVTGLSIGTFTVTITDVLGCITNNSVTITQPDNPLGSIVSPLINVSCFGGNDGYATATVSGGTPPYIYSWNNGQATQTSTGLAIGNYSVTVSDSKGCIVTNTVSITQPSAVLSDTISARTTVSCFGGNDATATATPSGGTLNYSFSWSNGQTAATVTGLAAGTHTVVITDAKGCLTSDTVVISQPKAKLNNIMFPQVNVSCFGGNDGYVSANAKGGTSPYSYSWNTGATTQTVSNLGAGSYSVTITDAKGCMMIDTASIFQPTSSLTKGTVTQQNTTCNGDSSGSATINLIGGTPPYYYSWSKGGATTQTITGLTQGTYSVIVFDDNGCNLTHTLTITEPPTVAVTMSGNDSICPGGKAILTATATGGTPGYSYTWQPGSFTGGSVTVSPGTTTTYSVVASDANKCASPAAGTYTVTVKPPAIATVDTSVTGTFFNPIFHFINPSNSNLLWYWDFADGTNAATQSASHIFPAPGTYNVMHIANNIYNCPDTFYSLIFVPDSFFIPNVITPSGNNKNENWFIPNSSFKQMHLEIYDRWGVMVYQSDAPDVSWDGYTLEGKKVTDGTYYFIADVELKVPPGVNPKKMQLKGPITVLSNDQK